MAVERYDIEEHPSAPAAERWSATDSDTFDAEIDSNGRMTTKCPVGWGATPDEAIEDLLRLLQEYEEIERDHNE